MREDLPIWILEPELAEKRELTARKLFEGGQKSARIPETVSISDIKEQIRERREYAADNIETLIEQLKDSLGQQYPGVTVKTAADNVEAAQYIKEVSGGVKVASINNSSIVTQELKPELISGGFTVVNSYLDEYSVEEKKVLDYWDLPRLLDKNLTGTFGVAARLDGLPDAGAKQYLAVLGVNAISADDGTVFFLQHYHNIHNDLDGAEKVFLVVGLDKIARDRDDAAFQTRCMGIFGMESVVLSIKPRADKTLSIESMELPAADRERELHIIILDNGRSRMLEGKFKELFLCIGCRACNKHCPIQHSFTDVDYIWTPRNYLNQFLYGTSRSIDICLHCEGCRLECPLDIDLPHLMWQAKMDYVSRHSPTFSHRILGSPEVLAKLGTLFGSVANWMMKMKIIRVPMEFIAGIDRKTVLPEFHFRTFRRWLKNHG